MKQLWAPWRTEYITAKKSGECIFCTAKSKGPKDGLVLFDGSLSLVMLNKFPYNIGHLMVSPLRHVSKLEELTPEESIDLFRLLRHSAATLSQAFNPEGFNIGMNIGKAAGAGVDGHLHLHIVPRWEGDTNFMPFLSETKVISEHIEKTYTKLKPLFERI
jgi:ATP adenylyltransferase